MTTPILTQAQLKEVLRYCPDTGLFAWRHRGKGRPKNLEAGRHPRKCDGYHTIAVKHKTYMAHRLAWLYVYGEHPKGQIDHINHIRHDNRINNLRVVTHTANGRNQKRHVTNTSGCCGVHFNEASNKWFASIRTGKATKFISSHVEWWDAVCARKSKAHTLGFNPNHGV